ncbi:glucose-6-phosphate isomerase [Microbulbifer thermotolerans]|uniref:glucose-6-phosphate isomerase n=1 Tax=Microbulbifer thermotolerans TaxID=252514 RepID=UPI0022489D64|nr:glucose-6-phosphate isomerase [Microbulbifer thermotolerans]MCX2778932.1 glucose-6-phosphate isomerase [Microbulbifer thermotolerans]MCX2781436.1 glucose-6-phosphate isomerase [Microbulbifer thermotolerans]MCX2793817.1 glucose-6-phosphate isomerase [Microbulbifer thermotolerans]MCX2804237.1 glucose-6-phosphate isomerase [Microbulbifer thermotolerans]
MTGIDGNGLESEAIRLKEAKISEFFLRDSERASRFTFQAAGLILDLSKNMVDDSVMGKLIALAKCRNMSQRIEALLSGERVNSTERRAAAHTALRLDQPAEYAALARTIQDRISTYVACIHSGAVRGFSGKPFTRVINIGIGGSDLGPKMVCSALDHCEHKLETRFVSNVDGSDIASALADSDPESTLFVLASKTFTTQETLRNAQTARLWLQAAADGADIASHFVAVTAVPERAEAFGVAADQIFPMWDWVGGRYSLWSAIGISIALAFGGEVFAALRNGAAEMDRHFAQAPLSENLPVLMGLLGCWYRNYLKAQTQAIIPYAHNLRLLPAYLQQLEMESNGKSVTRDGEAVPYTTAPVIWGESGTNGQHSFHQLLHQGTDLIPVDFVLPLKNPVAPDGHQPLLVANCLAQSRALMMGKSLEQARIEFLKDGCSASEAQSLAPARAMPGNRPSTLLMMEALIPETLGALIALYEHKVYVQSVIWDINAFDQWGVELGKQLCGDVLQAMSGLAEIKFDGSTDNAIARFRSMHPKCKC